ncbi:ABC transporter permease [Ferruginibacter sp. SUN106]|uniref:ABC transporter permease n=1 Tax=Ferruginibacter sp. SUN106 TaxID=2978348 RepID=UPI003D35D87A
MIKNYFKLAWRNLRKNKSFSFINIVGLSVGIAFVMLIGAYIYSEINVNADIKNSDRIYMVQSKWKDPNMGYDFATLAPLAKALKENYPGIVDNYYHHDGITSIVSKGDKKFSEGLQVGDTSMLDMFGFPLLYGDAKTALNKPDAVAITAAIAKKYFGKTDVLGQTLTIQSFSGSKQDFEITAVLKDPPMNTITNWGNGINKGENQFFLPASSLRFFGRDAGFEAWQNAFIISYVELKKGATVASLQQPVKQLMQLNVAPDVQKNLEIFFTPVKDYYLKSNNGIAYRLIFTLGFVAAFILLMAVINFVNISVGSSVSRLKEIGVRKVMGSSRVQLIIQFLSESVLLVAFAVAAALVLYIIARPYFSDMLGKQLPLLNSFSWYFVFIPLAIIAVVGVLAGIYPAFLLSKQRSVESLKGKLETVKEKIAFRYSLIGLQFITAIVVFVAAITINKQVGYFFSKDLGYTKDQVITAKVPRDWTPKGVQHMATIRNEFATLPEVEAASFSFEIPDGASSSMNNTLYKATQDSSQGIIAESLFTDEKYIATYKIPVAAGKFFNADGGTPDSTSVVINESAVKGLGWKEATAAIGQQIKFQGNPGTFTVGGVVKDFHFGPLQEAIRPMYFIHVSNAPLFRYMSFKIKPGNTGAAIAAIQKKWSVLLPDAPFAYTFMDDTLARLYSMEVQMKKAATAATVIALLIVLLGVLGIVTQSISKRTKEVGIRKVLGASVVQVILLFAKEFSIIIIVANIIAWPVAYFALRNWLNNYAYRIDLTFFPFIMVGLVLLLLVALLIAVKTIRTALMNPVKSLRTE